ncbi:hypothetical protein NC653_027884 [Populus alba x Populus x berolinensis]|uniref:ETFB lysine methyltransferase n=1 Tax=Populus alba x Populus x berolinensis TaxID=444605 RepID=A0AAD6Q6Q5_9ROSI|nr:hypothetical protein NC653_027884 [Populus alba x Populus x berolinensis]
MSRSHFFKHLSYTLVHHHRPSYLSPPLSFTNFHIDGRNPALPHSSQNLPFLLLLLHSLPRPQQQQQIAFQRLFYVLVPVLQVWMKMMTLMVCIDSIFPEFEDVGMCLSQAANSIGLKETPPFEVNLGDQYEWVRKTQDVQATNIILNPGLAFGTGEHPTTKLCLLLLKKLIKGEEHFLDYGTGSGVLAIAALKFGAALSVGFDIEPQAIMSARHNATLNSIGPEKMQLHLVPGKTCSSLDGREDEMVKEQSCYGTGVISGTEKYDVVIANILLNPLLDLADHIVSYAKPRAVVGISGIISEQCSRIVDRYSMLLEDISVSEMDGWACLILAMACYRCDVEYYGDHIFTTVTKSASVVDRWIDQIMHVYQSKLSNLIIGLDTEWFLPAYPGDYQKIAILQLCVGRRCLIFQLCHADYFPQSLIDFLGNKKYTFVGKEVRNDASKLMNDYGLNVGHCRDVAYWAASKHGGEEDFKKFGLKRLVLRFLKKELEKPLKITLSRWDRKELNYQQIKYACLDAFVSFKLGELLSKD